MKGGIAIVVLAFSFGCDDRSSPDDAAGLDAGGRDAGDAGAPDAFVYEEPSGCVALPGNTATVSLDLLRDDWTSSCHDGAGDAAFAWTAPARGRYVITCWGGSDPSSEPLSFEPDAEPQESELPPILSVLDGDCDGNELACTGANVALEAGQLTRAVVLLDAEQTISLVLDAPAGAAPYPPEYHHRAKLAIEPVACGTIDLGGDRNAHWEDWISGVGAPIGPLSCGQSPGNAPTEKSFRYVAPEAGRYIATLNEQYGEPVALGAFDPQCLDERACVAGVQDETAHLELDLQAGESVVLVASVRSSGDSDWSLKLDISNMPE